jgi:hypothetical protein
MTIGAVENVIKKPSDNIDKERTDMYSYRHASGETRT